MLGQQGLHQNLEAQHRFGTATSLLSQFVPRQHFFGWRIASVYEESIHVRSPEQCANELRRIHLCARCEYCLLVRLAAEEAGEHADQAPVEGCAGDVIARHPWVCGLREGSPPADGIFKALGTQDAVAVVVHHGDVPEVHSLGAEHQ
jgi:hypothetical protein